MRRRVWGLISLTLLELACGKSERSVADETAGTTTMTAAGSDTGAGGSSAGSNSSTSTGGAASTGGTSATPEGGSATGGMSVAQGGAAFEPGEGGDAGVSGAGGGAACEGPYHACGCGCCVGQASLASCVYPDLGEDLAKVSADNLARKMDVAACAAAGCSAGHDYFCCAAPAPSNDGASYLTSRYIGGIDRLRLHKKANDCSTFVLQQTSRSAPPDPRAFPVNVPDGWKIESITSSTCTSSAVGPNAIGAIGDFTLRVVDDACVADAHLTAFFSNAEQELTAVRFDADAVPGGFSVSECRP